VGDKSQLLKQPLFLSEGTKTEALDILNLNLM
jgi:hypothetical protein